MATDDIKIGCTSTEDRHELTRAEAVEFVKRQPASVKFHVYLSFYAAGKEEDDILCTGSLDLTRKQATDLVGTLLNDRKEALGARIPITIHTYKFITGSSSVDIWIV